MESTNWAPEHSDALREYLGRGMSFSEIAKAINAKFKTAYSRNAAIGRARRMGLAGTGPAEVVVERRSHRGWTDSANFAQPKPGSPAFHWPAAGVRGGQAGQAALRRDRAAPSFADRSRARRLPLSLWRRRRGRSHHLLRSSAPPGSSYCTPHFHLSRNPDTAVGTAGERRLAAAGRGGMKRMPARRAVDCQSLFSSRRRHQHAASQTQKAVQSRQGA